jgi:glycosyltransferase involved in cell wall biosynthesis
MKDFLIIEGCNFVDCPVGGQLSFAKQLLEVYGESVGLVGITERDDVPIGEWTKLNIDEKEMDFFAYRKASCNGKKPIIPGRISGYLAIRKYRKAILSKNRNALTQAPELLIAISNWGWDSLCYEFPGVENPLLMPRFKWGKPFANFYEKQLFRSLQKVDLILASAGFVAIQNLVKRSKGLLKIEEVIQFPTRVDTNFFKPIKINKLNDLNIDHSDLILVTCGRINVVKGWDLTLEAFKILKNTKKNVQLYFVGDGEDRKKLEDEINLNNLSASVHITGYQSPKNVLKWLNSADLVLVGSHKEGWSISMLESLACGKPIVSTDVSGAKEMISEGENGYIVKSRDAKVFSDAISKGLELKNVEEKSLKIASKYALSSLKSNLDKYWVRK